MCLCLGCSWFGFIHLSEQWTDAVLFHFGILSISFNVAVFIHAGVLCKLHARHGQYSAPRKVWTTQEGVCFRTGLRACSLPL